MAVIRERRPDLLLTIPGKRRLAIIEIAVAADGLVLESEDQKREKYHQLKADLGGQYFGWWVTMTLVVVGTLGVCGRLIEELSKLEIFSEQEVVGLAKEVQMEALVSAVRLMKRHLCR